VPALASSVKLPAFNFNFPPIKFPNVLTNLNITGPTFTAPTFNPPASSGDAGGIPPTTPDIVKKITKVIAPKDIVKNIKNPWPQFLNLETLPAPDFSVRENVGGTGGLLNNLTQGLTVTVDRLTNTLDTLAPPDASTRENVGGTGGLLKNLTQGLQATLSPENWGLGGVRDNFRVGDNLFGAVPQLTTKGGPAGNLLDTIVNPIKETIQQATDKITPWWWNPARIITKAVNLIVRNPLGYTPAALPFTIARELRP
jgi:hypothetical protein